MHRRASDIFQEVLKPWQYSTFYGKVKVHLCASYQKQALYCYKSKTTYQIKCADNPVMVAIWWCGPSLKEGSTRKNYAVQLELNNSV